MAFASIARRRGRSWRASAAESSRRPATACCWNFPPSSRRSNARSQFRNSWSSATRRRPRPSASSTASASISATCLIEGDDILGDGVNIAARLEGLCEPGGVLISGAAYEHIRGRIDAEFVDLGEKDLKNIARPVRVYALRVSQDAAPTPIPAAAQSARAAAPVDRRPAVRQSSAATRSRSISSTGSPRA